MEIIKREQDRFHLLIDKGKVRDFETMYGKSFQLSMIELHLEYDRLCRFYLYENNLEDVYMLSNHLKIEHIQSKQDFDFYVKKLSISKKMPKKMYERRKSMNLVIQSMLEEGVRDALYDAEYIEHMLMQEKKYRLAYEIIEEKAIKDYKSDFKETS